MGKLKGKDELATTCPRNGLLSGVPFPSCLPLIPASLRGEDALLGHLGGETDGPCWRGEEAASRPAGGQGGQDGGQSPGSTEIPERSLCLCLGTPYPQSLFPGQRVFYEHLPYVKPGRHYEKRESKTKGQSQPPT